MAGIGFELRRILAEDTYSSMVKGYLYATVISAGPWLLSVLCLGALGIFTISFMGFADRQLFASTMVYVYAASLLGTGVSQLIITRFLADKLYQGETAALCESLLPVMVVTLATQLPLAIIGLWGTPLPFGYRLATSATFLVISLIWQTMTFISASRDYAVIVFSFAIGAGVSVAGGLLWGRQYGVVGYMMGFGLGQFCILALLLTKVLREFGMPTRLEWGFLRYAGKYPQLVGIGLFYNASIWVDKILFGLSQYGRLTAERFPTYTHYDSSMFLAFAAMAPAMAIFLARTETEFADAYKHYYDDIFFRRPYDRILRSKAAMLGILKRSFVDLVKIQGLVTLLLVYFADDILKALSLPYSQTAIFRFALIGAFLQVLMLFIHIVLLYFDLRGTVLGLTLLFFVANAALTALSIALGFTYYGAGFAVAAAFSLLCTTLYLYGRLADLEFITFARRKIVGQQGARRRDRARPGGMYGRYLPCPGDDKRLAPRR
ncbi:MAG: exopolysaccharide Pel transporter PelG [Deltaproteobacteria bacterium]|nr:exopolysaccharide Pel transporter PelG [Deltaproteobacteria bacterium]